MSLGEVSLPASSRGVELKRVVKAALERWIREEKKSLAVSIKHTQ